jgi:hypothetical protein
MKLSILRFLEIAGGIALIVIGVVMLVTPGSGVIAIIAGITLISPQHGKRVIWWVKKFWRSAKSWWYSWKFKRVIRRKIFKKALALEKKFKLKK